MNNKLKYYWFVFKTSKYYGIARLVLRFALMIYVIGELTLRFGWWGFLAGCLIFVIITVLLSRDMFMYIVKDTETKLYGKPIDKFKKGEWKRPKIVWRKKKDEDN